MDCNDRLTRLEINFKLLHEAVCLMTMEFEEQRKMIISISKVILKIGGMPYKEDK